MKRKGRKKDIKKREDTERRGPPGVIPKTRRLSMPVKAVRDWPDPSTSSQCCSEKTASSAAAVASRRLRSRNSRIISARRKYRRYNGLSGRFLTSTE